MKTVLVVTATTPLPRDVVTVALTADVPDLTIVRHDMDPHRPGEVRQTTISGGHSESVWRRPSDPCPTCGLAEVAVQNTAAIPSGPIAVLLPVGASAIGLTRRLVRALEPGESLSDTRFAGVAAACDASTFEDDLLGDDLLRERNHHLYDGDDRSVGEVLAASVEHADFALTISGGEHTRGSGLIDLLRAVDSHRIDELTHHDLARLFDHVHHPLAAERRVDPLVVSNRPRHSLSGAWRMTLSTERPFHPGRLRQRLNDLGGGRFRSRGHFWLPTRPFTACAWDGAGGQLSIGALDDWNGVRPGTRLTFVGVGGGREDLVGAFDDAVLTADEEAAGWPSWLDVADEFDPWLGDRG